MVSPPTQETSKEERYNNLLLNYHKLLSENEDLKKQCLYMKNQADELKERINILEKDLNELSATLKLEKAYRVTIENSLKQILSKAQRDIVIDKKKMVVWSSDDISNAFTIGYFSKRCYTYLRETKKYPLPSISSLQRWALNLNLWHGNLNDVFRIMGITAQEMSAFKKVVVIQFDEVKVSSVYEYDKASDEVIGPYSQMQVVMARGIFAKWKPPI